MPQASVEYLQKLDIGWALLPTGQIGLLTTWPRTSTEPVGFTVPGRQTNRSYPIEYVHYDCGPVLLIVEPDSGGVGAARKRLIDWMRANGQDDLANTYENAQLVAFLRTLATAGETRDA